MKNKLLLTTAIAGTFAFAGASFAETKVVGNLETTINATSSDTAINSGRQSMLKQTLVLKVLKN
jgi:hypothetical protein